ncbi:MAG: hypothetical protein EXR11_11285 [Rhodospirillaceae bacterium]|nr:hypothetical protein [Rhodospirillaceae bacterium]
MTVEKQKGRIAAAPFALFNPRYRPDCLLSQLSGFFAVTGIVISGISVAVAVSAFVIIIAINLV